MREFGFTNPILVDSVGEIIAGHGRLMAANRIGMDEVPTITLDHLTDDQKRAYVIADNKLALNAGWDEQLLAIELQGLTDSGFDANLTGFSDEEVSALVATLVEPADGLTDEDAVPDVPEDPVTVLGDIWLMGDHRLACGDSLSTNLVDALMGGKQADCVFTDPPYNTGMKAQPNAGEKARLSHMFNDDYSDEDWEDFMSEFCAMYYSIMKDNTGAYICLDWRRNHELVPHLRRNFKHSNQIIWDKVVHGLGSDYKYTYEIINVCKKGSPELDTHQGDREYSDVWHIKREMGRNKDHATAKPVELVERCLRHASKPNAIVVDLFMGSGTTLIASEKLNRICYGSEHSPQYVDVAVSRWSQFTGKTATLESTGQTFEEVKASRE